MKPRIFKFQGWWYCGVQVEPGFYAYRGQTLKAAYKRWNKVNNSEHERA